MPNIGPLEIVLLLLFALLLFGAKRLPEIGRSVGQGMREFKDSVSGNSKPEAEELEPPVKVESTASTLEPTASTVESTASSVESTASAATHEHDPV
jgi:sec-independent protein translocase protein TatA